MTEQEVVDIYCTIPHRDALGDGETSIVHYYVQDRSALKEPDDLLAFVEKWRGIFVLSDDERTARVPEDVQNADRPLLLEKLRYFCAAGEPVDPPTDLEQLAMDLALPMLLAQAFITSKHYGVPENMAFMQAVAATNDVQLAGR